MFGRLKRWWDADEKAVGALEDQLDDLVMDHKALKEERDHFRQQVCELRKQLNAAKQTEDRYKKLREAVWAVFSQTEVGTGLYVQVDHHIKTTYYNAITSAIAEYVEECRKPIVIGPCCKAGPQSKEDEDE